MDKPKFVSFWRWFFCGSGGRAGYRRLSDRWLVFHLCVGAGLAYLVDLKLQECANAVLMPLAGIIIGLAFAWAGNAQALLQTSEMENVAEYHEGGFADYVYVYQTAILMILATLIVWSLAGLNVFDSRWPTANRECQYFALKSGLFALSSLAVRECWHVVLGAQWMLLTQREIKRSLKTPRSH